MTAILCFDGERSWYRQVLVEEQELFCSPTVRSPLTASSRLAWRPRGSYDLASYIKSLPAPWNDPSLVLVLDDCGGNSIARNLAPIKCPKVLVLSDTHHFVGTMRNPIGRPLAYAQSEPFDLIINQFTRQHVHFFHEAGLTQTAWLPSFTLTPFDHDVRPFEQRRRGATFIGGMNHHPHRRHVLQRLAEAAAGHYSMECISAPQRDTAALVADSRVSLNISLNGDLNLRIFETLAAGGLLISERLSPESGLDLLLEDRRHLVLFRTHEELFELVPRFLGSPAESSAIAQAGQRRYRSHYSPEVLRRQLADLLRGQALDRYEPRLERRTCLPRDAALPQRVAIYEMLQELHRNNLQFRALFWENCERYAVDAVDLPRLRVQLLGPSGQADDLIARCCLGDRIERVDPRQLMAPDRRWELLICPPAAAGDPLVERCLQQGHIKAILFTDAVADGAQPLVQKHRLVRANERPLLLTAPGS